VLNSSTRQRSALTSWLQEDVGLGAIQKKDVPLGIGGVNVNQRGRAARGSKRRRPFTRQTEIALLRVHRFKKDSEE